MFFTSIRVNLDALKTELLSIARGTEDGAVASVDVVLDGGLYSLKAPLVLDAEEAPELKKLRLSVSSAEGEMAMITSLSPIDASLFEKAGEGVYKCALPFALQSKEIRGRHAYYLDGSSSNREVYENVTHAAELPVFSQFNVPSQYTRHNYIHDIYSTKPIDQKNSVPERDMRLGECFVVTEGLEALFEKYPKAREIYENSGCRVHTKE